MPTDPPQARTGAFAVAELMVTMAIFSVLSLVLMAVLQMVTKIWYRTSARDDAIRQLHQGRARLVMDLANSSQQPDQFAIAKVGPNLGTGFDGDALSILSSDDGSRVPKWNVDPSTGRATPAAQITFYLVVPNAVKANSCLAGPPDPSGYEQQCPYKWLIRRVDPVPAPPPDPAVPATWTTWLTRPSSLLATPTLQVVADQLLEFRVLSTPPTWTIRLSAVAVTEATRQLKLGSVPLSQSKFTMVEQFTVPAHN